MAALIAAGVSLVLAMAAAWVVQRRTQNSGWIDMIWTFAVGAVTLLALALLSADPGRKLLLAALVATWSVRLGLHILVRTRRSTDDPRYAKLMEEWGQTAPWRLFLFLQVQALAAFVLVLAVVMAATSVSTVSACGTLLFAAIAAGSILGEAAADAQLATCKASRPANGICDRGLWGLSRHPNYFFEWLFWVGIAGMAISPPTDTMAFLALLAPTMMYGLLRYASGVPHLEAHMRRTRPDAYADYARRVPEFFPRIPW